MQLLKSKKLKIKQTNQVECHQTSTRCRRIHARLSARFSRKHCAALLRLLAACGWRYPHSVSTDPFGREWS